MPRLSRHDLARVLPRGLLLLALLWYSALIVRFHSSGAVGTDPATYVQMALDLAATGQPTHVFPLFNMLYDRGFSWDALLPPGYRVTGAGQVAPTFAFGLPLLLALGYRLAGPNALEWGVPLTGLACLVSTYALGCELMRAWPPLRRRTASALAALVLAATPKQIQLALVPMSDVPAQLLCVLAMFAALRALPAHSSGVRARVGFVVLGGLALGLAYLVRHSALVMLVPLAFVAARWGPSAFARLAQVGVALGAAALVAFPDFIYRGQVFGSPFAIESPDAARLAIGGAPAQLLSMLVALVSLTGLGPIVLLAPVGLVLLFRTQERLPALALFSWPAALMLLHAPLYLTAFFENNLRYLIPAYPALALAASVALVWLFTLPFSISQPPAGRVSVAGALVALIGVAALAVSLRALVAPDRFVARAYGWMSPETRFDLETLAGQLPPGAVVGTSDQFALAVQLYAHRDTFRPGALAGGATEFQRLTRALPADRPVYVLGAWACPPTAVPGEELPAWLASHLTRQNVTVRNLYSECPQDLYLALQGE